MAFWRNRHLQNDAEVGLPTRTTTEQAKVEQEVLRIYKNTRDKQNISDRVHLLRKEHLSYLNKGLENLPFHFECLDASRPWLCYWILHSLELLKQPVSPIVGSNVVKFLGLCQHPDGGFAGGPGQLPHLAPTYAAVLALCTIGTPEAYTIINRPKLQFFLTQMHQSDGSYIMHKDGEVDVRGAYCALVAASLVNVLSDQLIDKTSEWIASCQTYEGGFSAVPGTEAHGGYTFCGYAALLILGKSYLCDTDKVLKWASRRQMSTEGGFQGRTNKLVDGCYSLWVGGLFPLIHLVLTSKGDDAVDSQLWQFHQEALQEYILFCCQSIFGGLLDKPGKSRDYYHTCYCLSGLSLSQHCISKTVNITRSNVDILEPIHPAFNISFKKATQATEYFTKLPNISIISKP